MMMNFSSPDQVDPLTGPIGGGSYVNISGKDLGSRFEEVQNAVSIAGIRCAPLRDQYQPSQWIVCRLGAIPMEKEGEITVALPDRPAVNYHEKFKYQVGSWILLLDGGLLQIMVLQV